MSYNYNSNRHNSIGGNWHLSSNGGFVQDLPSDQQAQPQQQQQQQQQQPPGFRNPWFSAPSTAAGSGSSALSQSPTKGPPSLNPLLAQTAASRRLSFANQLPTTYETEQQQQQIAQGHRGSIVPPFIHPPTRADNPFNYYTSQEVSLGGGPGGAGAGVGGDRRMSAAAVGTYGGVGAFNYLKAAPVNVQIPPGTAAQGYQSSAQQQHLQHQLSHQQMQLGGAQTYRRSSVAVGAYQPSWERGGYYTNNNTAGSQYWGDNSGQEGGRGPQTGPIGTSGTPVSAPGSGGAGSNLPGSGAGVTRKTPRARRINSRFDLRPKPNSHPKYRRCSINSIHISPVNALSVYITESYAICQPKRFQYSKSTNPKRVLTKPSEPKFNNGFDNEDSDYILYVNDILGTEEGRKYIVLDLLGCGTFGQVVKCQNLSNQSLVAVKVIKSKPAYMNQSLTEVRLLEFLNVNSSGKSFIRLLDTFMHKEHLCLVFELLASNLYELIKQNQFQGLNMRLVKLLTRQLLESLSQLKGFQMIHCDLKPENILLCQPDKPDIKVIDFGSACFTRQTSYTYIQSRFYRSPEVILGLPYTESIDMWSLGCIVGELFLGLPMFPGNSEYNQIWKIVDMLGLPPRHMIEVGRNASNFFAKEGNLGTTASGNATGDLNTSGGSSSSSGPGSSLTSPSPIGGPASGDTGHGVSGGTQPVSRPTYRIRSMDEYLAHVNGNRNKSEPEKTEKPNKMYFKQKSLKDIILNYKLPSKKMTPSMIEREWEERYLLIDFLSKVLNMNPLERLTPQEALKHPFVNETAKPNPGFTAGNGKLYK
ncbi:dual specificity protein kinase Yak1p [[Candida] anglica]